MRAWVLRRRKAPPCLTMAARRMLSSTMRTVSTLWTLSISTLNSPAHTHRYRRFTGILADDSARLAGERRLVNPSFQRTSTSYPAVS